MRSITKKPISTLLMVPMLLACIALLSACGGGGSAADKSQSASDKLQGQIYQSTHNVEFRNYNLRQKMSDDPATILWCTFFPPGVQNVTDGSTPGQAFTVPIAGKLTSSNKRPYQGSSYSSDGYSFEVPGPDHMFGGSSEYRYGFDPTLSDYSDFTSLASYCTTQAKVWQTQQTKLVVLTDTSVNNLTTAAEQSIRAGNPKQALDLLKQAETSTNTTKKGKP